MDPGVHRCDLDDVANDEYEHTDGEIAATTKPVGSVSTSERADESTNGHEGYKQGRNRGIECFLAIALVLSKTLDEVLEDEDSTDLTLHYVSHTHSHAEIGRYIPCRNRTGNHLSM